MALTLLMLSGLGPARAQNTANAVQFSIAEFVVEGNTVLPVVAIERAIYPFTGPARTIADAEAARRALEKAYHDAGHLSVLVELPAQRITNVDAEIRLVVIEAPVAQLRVTGAEYTLPSTIRAQTPSVAPGAIPDFNQLQSELGRLNSEGSRREITPLITASETAGAIDVELKVKEAVPFSGFIEVNNKQAENTERGRVEASATYSNLFQLGHTIGLYWFVSPREPSQANIVALNYRVPVGGPGDSLLFGYTYSDSSTPTELGGSTIGSGDTYILQWNKQLKPVGSTQHSLTFGLAYRDQKDTNKDVAGFDTSTSPIQYPTLGADYSLSHFWELPGRVTTLDVGLTFGLETFGKREIDCNGIVLDQFACKRAGASAEFQVLTLGISHREPIFSDWSVWARVRGQAASGPLVPSEQLTLGGVDSVRGYFEGQYAGDTGAAFRLELVSPVFLRWQGVALNGLVFFDRGYVDRLEPLPGEPGHINLGSYGLGLRVASQFGLEARLDWATTMFGTASPAVQFTPEGGTPTGTPSRWDFGLRYVF